MAIGGSRTRARTDGGAAARSGRAPLPVARAFPVVVAALLLALAWPLTGSAAAKVPLPPDVRPTLARAATDEERLRRDGCLAFEPATVPRTCVYGVRTAGTIVALVGDSHAAHLFPAIEALALARGWRLVTFVKVSCPFTRQAVHSYNLGRSYRECTTYVGNAIARLKALGPDLVITAAGRWMRSTDPDAGDPATQGRGIGAALAEVPGRKVVIVDVPYSWKDIPECLGANRSDVRRCAIPRIGATAGGVPVRERKAAGRAGGTVVDLTAELCGPTACAAISDGMIRYRDQHHLTATFARSLAPAIGARIGSVSGG